MREALKQAKKAAALGEVPIGCVIVYQGRIIGRGYNRRNTDKSTFSHAEDCGYEKGGQSDRRLEAGGLCHVRDPGTLPDVLRSHRPGQDTGGGDRLHESQSRMRGLHTQSAGNAGIQPPGQGNQRRAGTGVLRDAQDIFP